MKTNWKWIGCVLAVVCLLACGTGCDPDRVVNVLDQAPAYLSVQLQAAVAQLQAILAGL